MAVSAQQSSSFSLMQGRIRVELPRTWNMRLEIPFFSHTLSSASSKRHVDLSDRSAILLADGAMARACKRWPFINLTLTSDTHYRPHPTQRVPLT